jgi:hypothetical protein
VVAQSAQEETGKAEGGVRPALAEVL